MNWTDPPEVTVQLSGWGYFGFALLGLLALAVFIVAAFLISHGEGAAGGIMAIAGVPLYAQTAFAYFRTVEIAFDLPNVSIWIGLLGIGVVTSYLAYRLFRGSLEASSLVPVAGATVATLGAAGLDKVNEQLAHIPMAWATVVGIGVLGVLVITRAGSAAR